MHMGTLYWIPTAFYSKEIPEQSPFPKTKPPSGNIPAKTAFLDDLNPTIISPIKRL